MSSDEVDSIKPVLSVGLIVLSLLSVVFFQMEERRRVPSQRYQGTPFAPSDDLEIPAHSVHRRFARGGMGAVAEPLFRRRQCA